MTKLSRCAALHAPPAAIKNRAKATACRCITLIERQRRARNTAFSRKSGAASPPLPPFALWQMERYRKAERIFEAAWRSFCVTEDCAYAPAGHKPANFRHHSERVVCSCTCMHADAHELACTRQDLHGHPHHGVAMSVTGSSAAGGVLHHKCRTRWVEHETHADQCRAR